MKVSPVQGVQKMQKKLVSRKCLQIINYLIIKLKQRDTLHNNNIFMHDFVVSVSKNQSFRDTWRHFRDTLASSTLARKGQESKLRDTWQEDMSIKSLYRPIYCVFVALQVSPSVAFYAYQTSPSVSTQEVIYASA
jgi:hypothetical protein